jgi:hypothetical protein
MILTSEVRFHRAHTDALFSELLTFRSEHRLTKLRRAVEDASTEFAIADSKKMHLNARLQQDEDEVQALKDKVELTPVSLFFCCYSR